MSSSTRLALPFIAPAQAQKHITHNDALQALDVLAQLSVSSASQSSPPPVPLDGDAYLIASSATDAWTGREGHIAAWQDGVWAFFVPREGWRCFVADEGHTLTWTQGKWRRGNPVSPFGSALIFDVTSETHVLAAATSSDTAIVIPERCVLFGITCLVTDPVLGPASFAAGVAADPLRFGNGIGVGLNAQLNGIAQPQAYYTATPIRFTASSGSFTGGSIQVSAHFARLQIPDFQ